MGWVRIDDHFAEHPKLISAGLAGVGLQVSALCYANRYLTDGFIPKAAAERMSVDASLVASLVRLRLWDEVDGGYQIHDYLSFQHSKERIDEIRQSKTNRQVRWRNKAERGENGKFKDAPVDASQDALVAPYPKPKPKNTYSSNELYAVVSEQPQSVVVMDRPVKRPQDEHWDTLMAVCRIDTKTIPAGVRGKYNKVLKELKTLGATPDEIIKRAVAFKVGFKGMTLTPSALLQRWAEVEGAATAPQVKREELEIQQWINQK